MTVPMPRMLRQMCRGLVIAFPLFMLFGQHWRHALGGPGTRGVMAVAAFICPAAIGQAQAVLVADGAHALDRAVMRRIAMQLHMGSGCSVMDKPPTARADRRPDYSEGREDKGNGKSM